MRQLPLDISPAAVPSLDNYVPGGNAEALDCLRALARGALLESVVYLWGEEGCGRTHLLRAVSNSNPRLVVADDVELLSPAGQHDLFNSINAAREGQAAVLAAGSAPPAQLALREDLRTRLGWGLVYQLRPLSDEDRAVHMRAEAARRGLPLPEEVLTYLLHRLPRDVKSLGAVLDALDRYSLERRRAPSVALARELLSNRNDG